MSPTSAVIWFYTAHRPGGRVFYREADAAKATAKVVIVSARASGPATARVTLPDLKPNTAYVYRCVFGSRAEDSWKGAFRTAPRLGTPTKFRFAVSSCMKHDHDFQDAWLRLLETKPDFQLLLGDNVYADSTVRGVLWDHYLKMRGVWQFAAVVRNIPTYAMWDDHDFAGDNRGGEVRAKAQVLDVFREVWANPSAGTPEVPGTFFKLSRGDVDFFVLDGRYHRSPLAAPNGKRKRMLGDGQFRWFAQAIRASKARFKIIASGSTIEAKTEDNWMDYRFELERIWRLIRDEKIGGVIWVSGDLHEGQLETFPKARTGFYDLTEVISSGIANSRDHEFAIMDFDTTVKDPTCHIQVLDGHGKLVEERTLRCSALQVR